MWWAGISMEVGAGGGKEEGGTVVTTFKGNSGVVFFSTKMKEMGGFNDAFMVEPGCLEQWSHH